VSGSKFAVGHDLYSCTKEMNISKTLKYNISRDGHNPEERLLYFIDTPGLGDTSMSQVELFEDITASLMEL
jgi:hypothetical protein